MTLKVSDHVRLRKRRGKWTVLEIDAVMRLAKVRCTSGKRLMRVVRFADILEICE